jgi:hypothetical protein
MAQLPNKYQSLIAGLDLLRIPAQHLKMIRLKKGVASLAIDAGGTTISS